MKSQIELELEFSHQELLDLYAKINRETRYQTSISRRQRLQQDSMVKLDAISSLIDWEMDQLLLEAQFTVDEFYETVEQQCPDPRTRPFIGTYCLMHKAQRKVMIVWYRPRPFKHPRTGKSLVYGKTINKGANYSYKMSSFKRFPAWVQSTVKYLEERNARKRKRVELLQKMRTLLRLYRKQIEQEYY